MTYEILNVSGLDANGQIGKKWSAYKLDPTAAQPIMIINTIEATSTDLNDQLAAIGTLATNIISLEPTVQMKDVLITGEYLTISAGSKSYVKQYFMSLIS